MQKQSKNWPGVQYPLKVDHNILCMLLTKAGGEKMLKIVLKGEIYYSIIDSTLGMGSL